MIGGSLLMLIRVTKDLKSFVKHERLVESITLNMRC